MLSGRKPIRTGPPDACGRWVGSVTAIGVDHAWSGGTGNQNEGAFPVCSQFCSQFVLSLCAQERPTIGPVPTVLRFRSRLSGQEREYSHHFLSTWNSGNSGNTKRSQPLTGEDRLGTDVEHMEQGTRRALSNRPTLFSCRDTLLMGHAHLADKIEELPGMADEGRPL